MSPEVLLSEEYGLPSDVFSLGMIFVEMLTGQEPSPTFPERPPQVCMCVVMYMLDGLLVGGVWFREIAEHPRAAASSAEMEASAAAACCAVLPALPICATTWPDQLSVSALLFFVLFAVCSTVLLLSMRAHVWQSDVFRGERRGDRAAPAAGLPVVALALAVAVPLRRAWGEVSAAHVLAEQLPMFGQTQHVARGSAVCMSVVCYVCTQCCCPIASPFNAFNLGAAVVGWVEGLASLR